jgi:hypothetical protein
VPVLACAHRVVMSFLSFLRASGGWPLRRAAAGAGDFCPLWALDHGLLKCSFVTGSLLFLVACAYVMGTKKMHWKWVFSKLTDILNNNWLILFKKIERPRSTKTEEQFQNKRHQR